MIIYTSCFLEGGGLLELDEIVTYIRKLGEEAPNKIVNLENRFSMSIKGKSPLERYFPPETGLIRVQVLDSFVTQKDGNTLTRLQVR